MLPYLVIKGDQAEAVIGNFESTLATMRRPKRRDYHIALEREAMTARGWD